MKVINLMFLHLDELDSSEIDRIFIHIYITWQIVPIVPIVPVSLCFKTKLIV